MGGGKITHRLVLLGQVHQLQNEEGKQNTKKKKKKSEKIVSGSNRIKYNSVQQGCSVHGTKRGWCPVQQGQSLPQQSLEAHCREIPPFGPQGNEFDWISSPGPWISHSQSGQKVCCEKDGKWELSVCTYSLIWINFQSKASGSSFDEQLHGEVVAKQNC
jgi:hypothetical protein